MRFSCLTFRKLVLIPNNSDSFLCKNCLHAHFYKLSEGCWTSGSWQAPLKTYLSESGTSDEWTIKILGCDCLLSITNIPYFLSLSGVKLQLNYCLDPKNLPTPLHTPVLEDHTRLLYTEHWGQCSADSVWRMPPQRGSQRVHPPGIPLAAHPLHPQYQPGNTAASCCGRTSTPHFWTGTWRQMGRSGLWMNNKPEKNC